MNKMSITFELLNQILYLYWGVLDPQSANHYYLDVKVPSKELTSLIISIVFIFHSTNNCVCNI